MAAGGLRGGSPAAPAWSPGWKATCSKAARGPIRARCNRAPTLDGCRSVACASAGHPRLFFCFKFDKRSGTALNSSPTALASALESVRSYPGHPIPTSAPGTYVPGENVFSARYMGSLVNFILQKTTLRACHIFVFQTWKLHFGQPGDQSTNRCPQRTGVTGLGAVKSLHASWRGPSSTSRPTKLLPSPAPVWTASGASRTPRPFPGAIDTLKIDSTFTLCHRYRRRRLDITKASHKPVDAFNLTSLAPETPAIPPTRRLKFSDHHNINTHDQLHHHL